MKRSSVKRFVVIIAGFILAVAGSYTIYSLGFGGSPRIEITPPSKDLGDVTKEGFNYTFIVKNTGKKVLEIERVSTSCGCTSATIEQEHIMPDGKTGLHVTFNPKLMEEEVQGKISRIIFIKSNDPENPELEIKIIANVVEG